jgi:hypothetical protein
MVFLDEKHSLFLSATQIRRFLEKNAPLPGLMRLAPAKV